MTARSLLACADVEPLLSPCADRELLEEDEAAVRAHVAGCASCRARLDQVRRLKATVAAAGRVSLPELPPGLALDLRAVVRREAHKARFARAGLAAAGLAAAVLAGVLVAAAPARRPAPAPGPDLAAAALQRHRLDLPVDVASPDPLRVQDFLASRVGLALRVPRLEVVGFGLQGGRVVDVDQRRGAQFVYTGGFGQRLSVLALPDPDGALAAHVRAAPVVAAPDGLAVRVLASGGTVYSIVGDVDDARLDRVEHVLER